MRGTPIRVFQPLNCMTRINLLRHRPEGLIPECILEQLDANEDFLNPDYKKTEGEMYNRICKHLSFDYLTNNCCAVCERCKPKAFTTFISVSDNAFVMRLRACVGFTPERRRRMPEKVQINYSVDVYDQRLKDIILSKYGLYRGIDKTPIDTSCFDVVPDLQLCICNECKNDMVVSDRRTTTSSAIANNCLSPWITPHDNDSDSDKEDSYSQSKSSSTHTCMLNVYCSAIFLRRIHAKIM